MCTSGGGGEIWQRGPEQKQNRLRNPTTTVLKKETILVLVVATARIFTLEKQNVDCMTEKLNILKGSQVPVMHLLLQTTSR